MTPSTRLLISVALATHTAVTHWLFMRFIIRGGASHDAQWEVQIYLEGESHCLYIYIFSFSGQEDLSLGKLSCKKDLKNIYNFVL